MRTEIKQFLKDISFKPKVKITFETEEDIDKYRYNKHCPNCGKFKGKNHKCGFPERLIDGKYKCSRCKRYLPYNQFQKDCTKRFGINTRCKQCRSETGNGNKQNKQRKKIRIVRIRW